MNQLQRCFRDCSLDHKITLKGFRQSLKCLEEDKSSASSFDRLADKGIDKGEAEPCFADLAWVPLLSPLLSPSSRAGLSLASWGQTGSVCPAQGHFLDVPRCKPATFIPGEQHGRWPVLHTHETRPEGIELDGCSH